MHIMVVRIDFCEAELGGAIYISYTLRRGGVE